MNRTVALSTITVIPRVVAAEDFARPLLRQKDFLMYDDCEVNEAPAQLFSLLAQVSEFTSRSSPRSLCGRRVKSRAASPRRMMHPPLCCIIASMQETVSR